MPEGPEVETIRRGLELGVVGQKIAEVEVLNERSFLAPQDLIEQIVVGAQVRHVRRYGKVLVWELSNAYSLMFHLKMTGQMVLVKADGERFAGGHPNESMAGSLPDRSTRVSLVSRLGPEALSAEFSVAYLGAQLTRHARAPVKAVILDQSTVAGVGNIYADESLHLARIHPRRLSGSLTPAEVKRLHAAVQEIIAAGVEHGGTSFAHYVNSLGGKGDYLEHARVFRREGQMCPVHPGTMIEKLRVAGRGTHICPRCQKL
jgi:formamidopyrimidine-DNA glycosylase